VAKSVDIKLDEIAIPTGRSRALQPAKVDEIAESMKAVGPLQNIIVRRIQARAPGHRYELIAGEHRLEGARKAGLITIGCTVLPEETTDEEAELIEIDENLKRAELNEAEAMLIIARRKEIYEKRFPETKHGGDRSSSRSENLRAGFVKETAKAMGKGRSTVAKKLTRVKKLGKAMVATIKGTSLNTPEQMEALAKLTETERQDVVNRAKAGDKITLKTGVFRITNPTTGEERTIPLQVTEIEPKPRKVTVQVTHSEPNEEAAAQEEQQRFDRAIVSATDDARKLIEKFRNWRELKHTPGIVVRVGEAAGVLKMMYDAMLEKQNKEQQKTESVH
jgi:hypothetical protein